MTWGKTYQYGSLIIILNGDSKAMPILKLTSRLMMLK